MWWRVPTHYLYVQSSSIDYQVLNQGYVIIVKKKGFLCENQMGTSVGYKK